MTKLKTRHAMEMGTVLDASIKLSTVIRSLRLYGLDLIADNLDCNARLLQKEVDKRREKFGLTGRRVEIA